MSDTRQDKKCTTILKMIGDFWTLEIVGALGGSEKRFCELEGAIPDINAVTLTARLKKMETLGLLKRKADPIHRQPVTYMLTSQGKGLVPIARQIKDFGKKFRVSSSK